VGSLETFDMAEAEKFFSQWKCQFFDKNSQKKINLEFSKLGKQY
jgi:hypothetical protein